MQSKNFDLEILNLDHAQLRLDYYSSNKEHLEIWHPTTPKGFYTLEYQRYKIKQNIDWMDNKESMHFVMMDKLKNKMIGHCNYTKIKNQKCWLGYSISKKSEGKNLMFEALLLANAYIYKNLNIKEIRAGILPENERSIRLIRRLGFKYIGKKDELEINGEIRTYDTYIQKIIKESKLYIKKMTKNTIKNLVDEFDQIIRWPKKPEDKEVVIKFLSTKFQANKKYSEKEINRIVNQFHVFNDTPLLRRELISRHYLSRTDNGAEYWKNKK